MVSKLAYGMNAASDARPRVRLRADRLPPIPTDPLWWVCFLSFTSLGFTQAGLMFSSQIAMLAPATFLALWFSIAMSQPARSIAQIVQVRLPLTLPLLACASALWSRDSFMSGKVGFEFLIAMVIGIYIGRRLAPAKLVSALAMATLMQAIASVAVNRQAEIFYAGNEALMGVFGSKNYMGYMASLLSLLSLSALSERSQPMLLRVGAAVGVLLGPYLVVQARSLDALVGLVIGGSITLFFIFVASLPRRFRVLVIASAAIMLVGALLAILVVGADLGQLLELAGKDSSLTGRTVVWQRAQDMIRINPLLGVGYNAFWQQGFLEAEGLWRQLHIESRAGFNFHNLYYEVSVELGLVGALVWGTFMFSTALACLIRTLRDPSPSTAFFAGFTILTLARMSLEVEMMGPFDIGPILFAIAWTYATAALPATRVGTNAPRRQKNAPMLEIATSPDAPQRPR